MQIKTVLVPYDFSENADRVFEWALEFATSWQAEIVLLHATPPISHVVHAESARARGARHGSRNIVGQPV